jgi:hypothetical protein
MGHDDYGAEEDEEADGEEGKGGAVGENAKGKAPEEEYDFM